MPLRSRPDMRALALVIVLLVLAILQPAKPVQAQQGPPTVHVDVENDTTVVTAQACDGSVQIEATAIVFYLLSPDPSPPTSVHVSWSGSLAADGGTKQYDGSIDALPSEIPLEVATGEGIIGMFPTRGGDLTLTIEPGPGYAVGTPSSATATLTPTRVIAPCPTAPTSSKASTPMTVELRETRNEPPAAVPMNASASYTG